MSARGLRHGLLGDCTLHSQRSITAGGDLHPALRIAPRCEADYTGFAVIDNDAWGSISAQNQSRSTYFWILVVDIGQSVTKRT